MRVPAYFRNTREKTIYKRRGALTDTQIIFNMKQAVPRQYNVDTARCNTRQSFNRPHKSTIPRHGRHKDAQGVSSRASGVEQVYESRFVLALLPYAAGLRERPQPASACVEPGSCVVHSFVRPSEKKPLSKPDGEQPLWTEGYLFTSCYDELSRRITGFSFA